MFGLKLSKVQKRIFENARKTKSAFPEETERIEFGLALMRDVTQITQDMASDYKTKPNLLANHYLFARNRQLLLNAYFCLLTSSYGTQFVILRAVLENNFLMRLFNKNPQFAFEWFSEEMQKKFSKKAQLKYGKSGKSKVKFDVDLNRRIFRGIAKEVVRKEISSFYKILSDYTHPNFQGWQELLSQKAQKGIIFNMPRFITHYADESVGITLYLMQLSFQTFHETFKGNLFPFAIQLKEWQDNFNKLIIRYIK